MNDVYVLVADDKINNCIYTSKDEAEGAVYQICSSIESWFKEYPVKTENIKIVTLYEYLKRLKKEE